MKSVKASKKTKKKPAKNTEPKPKPRPAYGFHIPATVKDWRVDHIIVDEYWGEEDQ